MTIDRVNPEAINRLDRFWESLLDNAEGVGEVESDAASTVRRLYVLDDAAGPDRAFVQGLELELVAAGRTSESGRTHRSAPTKDLFQGGEAAATVVVERPVGWSRKSLDVAAAVVLCLVVGVAAFGAWQLAGPTAEPSSAVPDGEGVALYVSDEAGQGVQPLDPLTLQDVPSTGDALGGLATPEATTEGAGWPSAWLASDDGSTVVRVDYRIDVSAPPSVLTVTVLDGRTGDARTRFVHEGLYRGVYAPPLLSGDGSRLLVPNEYLYVHVPGTRAGFSVYDTADGRLVSTIELFGSGDRIDTDRFFVGPTGDRLYAFSVINLVTGGPLIGTPSPFEEPAATVETPLLESYDLASGELVGGLELSALVQRHPSERFQMPAAALSPDGRQMAFVQANDSTLTIVDTERMVIDRTFLLGNGGRMPTPAPAPAPDTIERILNPPEVIGEAVFSPDGQRLFVRWARLDVDELTIRVQSVTIAERMMTAEVVTDRMESRGMTLSRLDGRLWVSPDGASLYVYGLSTPLGISSQRPPESRPWVLRRLDAVTLAVVAERELRGNRSVVMWVVG